MDEILLVRLAKAQRAFEARNLRIGWPAEAPKEQAGGARRDRTDDLMLAKHALSQLSYGP